jgi:hypothetical protein
VLGQRCAEQPPLTSGTPGYAAPTEMTDATQLARAIVWMATAPGAQPGTTTDNDVFRWKRL